MNSRLGVCSWSLDPPDAPSLAGLMRRAGVGGVQLALDPVRTGTFPAAEVRDALADAGARILSGMIAMEGEDYSTIQTIQRTGGLRPDDTWSLNLRAAEQNARLAADLDIPLVTFHAGMVPRDANDPRRAAMLDRVQRISAPLLGRGIRVGLETGPDDADAMLGLLHDLDTPGIGVNFDPANLVLYGTGDPIEALDLLAPRVLQIHVKDALPPEQEGDWGREVVAGAGAVDWGALFDVVRSRGLDTDFVIERESGQTRIDDIKAAAALVRAYGVND